ncbi:MAG: PLP-dependent aminotransferase family protein [Gammaproteobacteria bacterium]|nr:PLP-dependent aminotransferase family protein [Gammaproteobacteria bacterium]
MSFASIAFELRRDAGQPLFVQLCDQIRERIISGQISTRLRLPASRNLAIELSISRSTVVIAYEQLVAEGYIEGRRGSGYYLRELAGIDQPRHRLAPPASEAVAFETTDGSPLSHPGYPDNRLFPYRQWARSLARSARLSPQAMIVSESPFGDPQLRKSIANYLADWRGLAILPEQVMVTAGSVDALETCIRTLTSPGDVVGLENPGYRPLRNLVTSQGMDIEWLSVGANGAELPRPARSKLATRLVVITPSSQFPLGGAMPVNRRREYQQWANANDAWIIEDDYDSEFRYAGRPIPALASLDDSARTIYVGTFSKVFSVSLRLAYLIMPLALIPEFRQNLSRFGVKAALPCQRALAEFIDGGEFYRHIRRIRRIYGDRRRLLLDLVQQRLSPYAWFEDHQAGMQVALRLRPGLDDQAISRQAQAAGVQLAPLSAYYGGGDAQQGLLLGFCPFDEAEIHANIELLTGIIESHAES